MQGSMQIGRYKRFMQIANQILSTTGYETQCSTKGESYRFSPLWSNGPRLHEGKPHLPAQAGRSYARGKPRGILRMKKSF